MISVRAMGDGTFAVIDGMHRVTSLQELSEEKWLDIDYDHVRRYRLLVTSIRIISIVL